jgi:hypothetical protein
MSGVAVMDGKTAVEHAAAAAEAIRAINHLTYHDEALPYPADAWRLLGQLGTAVHRLSQAVRQTAKLTDGKHQRGEIGIDPGTEYAGAEPTALAEVLAGLDAAGRLATALADALDRAAQPLTYAHHIATGVDGSDSWEQP